MKIKKIEKTTPWISLSTWQSISKQPRTFFEQFTGLLIDECHESTGRELTKVISQCINCVIKIGLTGSLKDYKGDRMQILGMFGGIVKTVSKTKELTRRGDLAKLKIKVFILKHGKDFIKKFQKTKTKLAKAKRTKDIYKEEVKAVNKSEAKIKFIGKILKSTEKNTLILFKQIEYGKRLFEMCKTIENREVFYIDGSIKVEKREEARKFCEKTDKVIIVASYGTYSTGINIRNLHNVIFAESMKSMTKILQSIGRLLRLHESKLYATLYDLTDKMTYGNGKNYMINHLLQRTDYYDRESHPYTIKEIELSKYGEK